MGGVGALVGVRVVGASVVGANVVGGVGALEGGLEGFLEGVFDGVLEGVLEGVWEGDFEGARESPVHPQKRVLARAHEAIKWYVLFHPPVPDSFFAEEVQFRQLLSPNGGESPYQYGGSSGCAALKLLNESAIFTPP